MKMCFAEMLFCLASHLTFNLATGMITQWECARLCSPKYSNIRVYDANGAECGLIHKCSGGMSHGECKQFRQMDMGYCNSCTGIHMMFQEKDCPLELKLQDHCDTHPCQTTAIQGSNVEHGSNQHNSHQGLLLETLKLDINSPRQ
ncbi:hypothetical protein PGT21_007816 [Puccinia graminis f. sp. tritici]|uniref:Uncharacterized protein n=1 Tax=Puccinia graminis f. sp. tritici TaxID=56615 RepID=A0A5B0LP38_PUCGR|nr:hypothetical protein PGTUg99_006007 [Puccinia graminis f. sp. tritici]KAA1065693.1 hypothetical protein PGT21_007816 [Puccinia graminis f. sp. tritici]